MYRGVCRREEVVYPGWVPGLGSTPAVPARVPSPGYTTVHHAAADHAGLLTTVYSEDTLGSDPLYSLGG